MQGLLRCCTACSLAASAPTRVGAARLRLRTMAATAGSPGRPQPVYEASKQEFAVRGRSLVVGQHLGAVRCAAEAAAQLARYQTNHARGLHPSLPHSPITPCMCAL